MQKSFLRHLAGKTWILHFRVSKLGLCLTLTAIKDGGYKRLVQLELACEADGVALLDPV